jgi:hypothetical protein
MTTISYNGTIPNPPNAPSADVGTMQTNAAAIAQWVSIDHHGFNDALGGWHKVIRIPQIASNSDPSPITSPANAGQVYTKTVSGDLELFYESSGGIISQLTPGTNGYSYLPGGIIVQWGIVNTTFASNTGTVTFAIANIAFPNNCFNVQITMKGTSGTANIVEVTGTPSKTAFTWQFTGGSGTSYTGFYWSAIGN